MDSTKKVTKKLAGAAAGAAAWVTNVGNEHENSEIEESDLTFDIPPPPVTTLSKINDIQKTEKNQEVSVQLKITSMDNAETINKGSKKIEECKASDETGSIRFVLWEPDKLPLEKGHSYNIKLQVKIYNGRKYLSTTPETTYEQIPDLPIPDEPTSEVDREQVPTPVSEVAQLPRVLVYVLIFGQEDVSTTLLDVISCSPGKDVSTTLLDVISCSPGKDVSTTLLDVISCSPGKNVSTTLLDVISCSPGKDVSTTLLDVISCSPGKDVSTTLLDVISCSPGKDVSTTLLDVISCSPGRDVSTTLLGVISCSPGKDVSTTLLDAINDPAALLMKNYEYEGALLQVTH
ncbi:hypothetical protein Bbelb_406670 [Branchiostoma belcheri]|nr:hypothetical protein Bbelb_406670 [Branchiostoma belcheri]